MAEEGAEEERRKEGRKMVKEEKKADERFVECQRRLVT